MVGGGGRIFGGTGIMDRNLSKATKNVKSRIGYSIMSARDFFLIGAIVVVLGGCGYIRPPLSMADNIHIAPLNRTPKTYLFAISDAQRVIEAATQSVREGQWMSL